MKNWIFIVVRDNSVEQINHFADFWVGAEFADKFIGNCDPCMDKTGYPAYNRGEVYSKDGLTIGLYCC